MATIRLFAGARDAAGVGSDELEGAIVDEIVTSAIDRYGPSFAAILPTCTVWVNGEPADGTQPVGPDDEVAFLPPVSGGS